MKRTTVRIVMILGLVAAIAPLSVTAQSLNFTVEVPYAFSVGDKDLLAGRYTIHRSPLGLEDVLVIESSDHKISQTFRMKVFLSNDAATENKKLIFTKYGDLHFLSQIWAISPLGKSTRYNISKSKRELELEKRAKQDTSSPQPEVVSLLVK
jgi:hypothetical protein